MIIAILVLSIINVLAAGINSYYNKGQFDINLPSVTIIVLTIVMLANNMYR